MASNHRPPGCKPGALPAELTVHVRQVVKDQIVSTEPDRARSHAVVWCLLVVKQKRPRMTILGLLCGFARIYRMAVSSHPLMRTPFCWACLVRRRAQTGSPHRSLGEKRKLVCCVRLAIPTTWIAHYRKKGRRSSKNLGRVSRQMDLLALDPDLPRL